MLACVLTRLLACVDLCVHMYACLCVDSSVGVCLCPCLCVVACTCAPLHIRLFRPLPVVRCVVPETVVTCMPWSTIHVARFSPSKRCFCVEGDLVLPAASTAGDTPAMLGDRASHRASPAASEATGFVTAAKRKKKGPGKHIQPSAKKMKQRDAAEKLQDHFGGLKDAIEASRQTDVGMDKVRYHKACARQ
jgi:hypothetical protein